MSDSSLASVTAQSVCVRQALSIISGLSDGIAVQTCENGSEVLPAIRDGLNGWKDTLMTGVVVSMTRSGIFGFTLLRSRFHVHTYDLSLLQSPSSTLK